MIIQKITGILLSYLYFCWLKFRSVIRRKPNVIDLSRLKYLRINCVNVAIECLNPGGEVWVPEGTINISSAVTIDKDGVTLDGLGPGVSIIRVANAANCVAILIGPGATQRRHITIRGIQIDGNRANQTAGVEHHGIYVRNGIDVLIEQCYIHSTHPQAHNTGGQGILVGQRSSRTTVKDCEFDDIGDRGVSIGGDFCLVHHCYFHGTFDRAVSMNSYEPEPTEYRGTNCIISDNIITNCSNGSGIGLYQYGAALGNIIYGTHTHGIRVDYNYAVVANNILLGGSGAGVRVGWSGVHSEILIEGNIIYDYATYGVWIVTGDEVQIVGNWIDRCGYHGIYASASENNLIDSNLIYACSQDADNTYDGINLDGSHQTVVGNKIDGGGRQRHGVYVGGDRCTINGNLIINHDTDGIYMDNADHTVITGNQITANTGLGVNEAGTSDWNLLDGSNVNGNTGGAHNMPAANSIVGDIIV